MFERLKRLYDTDRLDLSGLINAVNRKLITENQFYAICGIFFDQATGNKAGEGINAPKEVEAE